MIQTFLVLAQDWVRPKLRGFNTRSPPCIWWGVDRPAASEWQSTASVGRGPSGSGRKDPCIPGINRRVSFSFFKNGTPQQPEKKTQKTPLIFGWSDIYLEVYPVNIRERVTHFLDCWSENENNYSDANLPAPPFLRPYLRWQLQYDQYVKYQEEMQGDWASFWPVSSEDSIGNFSCPYLAFGSLSFWGGLLAISSIPWL